MRTRKKTTSLELDDEEEMTKDLVVFYRQGSRRAPLSATHLRNFRQAVPSAITRKLADLRRLRRSSVETLFNVIMPLSLKFLIDDAPR